MGLKSQESYKFDMSGITHEDVGRPAAVLRLEDILAEDDRGTANTEATREISKAPEVRPSKSMSRRITSQLQRAGKVQREEEHCACLPLPYTSVLICTRCKGSK